MISWKIVDHTQLLYATMGDGVFQRCVITISLYPEYNHLYLAEYLYTVPDLYLIITSNYFALLSNFYLPSQVCPSVLSW